MNADAEALKKIYEDRLAVKDEQLMEFAGRIGRLRGLVDAYRTALVFAGNEAEVARIDQVLGQ